MSAAARRNPLLMIALVIALGVRLAYIPAVSVPSDTSTQHGEFARNIVDHGRWFVINTKAVELVKALGAREHRLVQPAEVDFSEVDAHPNYQPYTVLPIGPSVVLAALWKLTGDERYIYVQIVQILVDSLVVLLVYRIALLLFKRRRTALIAAFLYAIFPPIAQQTSYFSPDIWAVDFTVAIAAAYLQAMHSARRWRWLIVCGALVGLGSFFRPNVVLFPLAFLLAGAVWSGWRQSLGDTMVVAATLAVVLAPWTFHNYLEYHRFIPTRSGVGTVLFVSLGEIHNNYGLVENELQAREEVHRLRPHIVYSTPAYDDYLRKRAFEVIEHHPLYYAKLVARRVVISTVAEYLSAWMHGGSESPFAYRKRTGRGLSSYLIHRPIDLLQSGLQPAVFLFAILAMALTLRGRRREHVFLIAMVLTTVIPYWLLHIETRYVLPASLAYLIWISLGVDLLAERFSHSAREPRTYQRERAQLAGRA